MCQNVAMTPPRVCDYCGGALPVAPRGRPRRWCSDACRRAGWVHRHAPRAEVDSTSTIPAQDAITRVLQSPTAVTELIDKLTVAIEEGSVSNDVLAALVRAHRASVGTVAGAHQLRPFRR